MDHLLLLSSSRVHGSGYLDFALAAIEDLLEGRRMVLFVPFAIRDHDRYVANVSQALEPLGVEVAGLHRADDPLAAVVEAEVLCVGGGNTFRLLRALQERGVMDLARERVRSGDLRYMSWSAGSNVACPSLRTTNDMPIVQPASFAALGLVPFQVNPHYADPEPGSTHMGETRADRIDEFLEENDVPVLGLREGAWLRKRGDSLRLDGLAGGRLFRRGAEPEEVEPGADLSWLLQVPTAFDTPA